MSNRGRAPEAGSTPRTLALAALGIVFGDIGTSPLYAVKECFFGVHPFPPTPPNVLGVLSLILWSLIAVVSVKYLAFIMRADNRGEGGIFALLALAPQKPGSQGGPIVLLALFGAALLYGDGIITPAISVLSAVEGLEVATAAARPLVVPLTIIILLTLFLVQKRGTASIGRIFGPVTLLWFIAIGLLGLHAIIRFPEVLRGVSPGYALAFFLHNGWHGWLILGSVVLCITGAEALYADMGHFGRRPIRLAWYTVVLPSLLLNYFGQGATILSGHLNGQNTFFGLVPQPLLLPMVVLATVATVIASQALISGAFSLTRQAVQLGYLPRMTVNHTSAETEGQIFVPEVNRALLVACIGLVLFFRSSTNLAAAYGIAVTGTMAITSIVYYSVVRTRWHWSLAAAVPLVAVFLMFDNAYLVANLLKFFEGGWFPIVVALGLFAVMTTWKRGRAILNERIAGEMMPLEILLREVEGKKPVRVRGTAVFMASTPHGVPSVLLHHLKHNQVLHEQVALLSIRSSDEPQVPPSERVEVETFPEGFFRVLATYGFMQTPNVPDIMRAARKNGLVTDPATTTFFLGRETILVGDRPGMAKWRKSLFRFMARNALSATAYFGIPPGRVVELGVQVEL